MYFSGHITGLSGTVMHLISTEGKKMPSELEDGKEDVRTPLNRFISLIAYLYSAVFTSPVCAWLASGCQMQCMQKIMLNNREQ